MEVVNENGNPISQSENKKLVAGILAIVTPTGGLGIHKFILGYTREGIMQIILTIVTCGVGGLIPFIEGIIYLTKTDEEFYKTYQIGKRGWF
ncbi:MAG: TM2 domain-containing protein [Flavobacteriaceae bacterium]|nr:TM2 domain-containing protein [Flavobacteriaceae bacterium]